jgi:L-fuconolactonase
MVTGMIDVPIVDAHVHLWEPLQFPRPWLSSLPELDRPFSLADYHEEVKGLPVTTMVYVKTDVAPAYALRESSWAVSMARGDRRLQGVVAAAPLDDGIRVQPHLEALAELGPSVKGVRRNLQNERDPDFCLRHDFVAGIRLLERYHFSFDICIRYDQLPAVTTLARMCPNVAFVLDHLGKPAIREGHLDPWREHLSLLATLPNVACKISGLVTEAELRRWRMEDLAPFVSHALTVFGAHRVLFGGDWPVVRLAASYHNWVGALESLTSQLSLENRRNFWGENARRWYRLPGMTEEQQDT